MTPLLLGHRRNMVSQRGALVVRTRSWTSMWLLSVNGGNLVSTMARPLAKSSSAPSVLWQPRRPWYAVCNGVSQSSAVCLPLGNANQCATYMARRVRTLKRFWMYTAWMWPGRVTTDGLSSASIARTWLSMCLQPRSEAQATSPRQSREAVATWGVPRDAYSEYSPTIHAAAYSTSRFGARAVLAPDRRSSSSKLVWTTNATPLRSGTSQSPKFMPPAWRTDRHVPCA